MRTSKMAGDQQFKGLLDCLLNPNYSSYCLLETIELCLTIIFILACTLETYKQIKLYGYMLRWQPITLSLMSLSLTLNALICLWNTTYELSSLQTYVNSLYFLTIVGYVCFKYVEKKKNKCLKYALIAWLLIMVLIYTVIMIDSLIEQQNPTMVNNSCQQTWYLCLNTVCISLCVLAFVILAINQKQQYSTLSKFKYSPQHTHNPMKTLWLWMGVNSFAQLVDLIETGMLLNTTPKSNCMIIQDSEVGNSILLFSFGVLSLFSGYAATLWFYAKIRRNDDQKAQDVLLGSDELERYSEEVRTGNIQLLNNYDSI